MNINTEIANVRRTLRLAIEHQDWMGAEITGQTGRYVEAQAARLMLQTDDPDALAMLRKCHENGSKLREAARTGAKLVAA
jgi:hypothetical protein